MKTDCQECKFFWHEYDTNASGCHKEGEISDEMWEGKIECPFFEGENFDDE